MSHPEMNWLGKWARYTPKKFFLREYESGREWNYLQFDRCVSALAKHLAAENKIVKGDRVAVLSKNRPEMILLFFALIRIGGILVPLNFRLTPHELSGLLKDADPVLFFYEKEFDKTIAALKEHKLNPDYADIGNLEPYLNSEQYTEDFPMNPETDFEDPVMILYTSGTTGIPKGAIINHRMLFWNAVNTSLRLNLTGNDHAQSFAPLFHTGGWNVLFTPFVHHGASHTLLKSFDADLILKLMASEKSTILFGVPTMMQMMAESPFFAEADLSSVRYAIVGGAPMAISLIEKWHQKGVPIRQGYGLTEVGPNTFSLNEEDAIRKIGSIGFPNFYIRSKVVSEKGEACPPGVPGELWLKSPVVTPGYWKKPEETAESITDGWFHTGDVVRYDDEDYFYVVDRKKNMFISGGENVYPAEIEALLQKMEGIHSAAVIGVENEKWGETGAAFLVKKAGSDLNEKAVIDFCTGKLAKYKIPKEFFFIAVIPLTETGKKDRNKLKEIYRNLTQ